MARAEPHHAVNRGRLANSPWRAATSVWLEHTGPCASQANYFATAAAFQVPAGQTLVLTQASISVPPSASDGGRVALSIEPEDPSGAGVRVPLPSSGVRAATQELHLAFGGDERVRAVVEYTDLPREGGGLVVDVVLAGEVKRAFDPP